MTAKIAPRSFWMTLLTDALPLLEQKEVRHRARLILMMHFKLLVTGQWEENVSLQLKGGFCCFECSGDLLGRPNPRADVLFRGAHLLPERLSARLTEDLAGTQLLTLR